MQTVVKAINTGLTSDFNFFNCQRRDYAIIDEKRNMKVAQGYRVGGKCQMLRELSIQVKTW